ncbi:Small-conductance mechanosensitive channel [Nitrosospira briensis]|uniref:Small-conductance mechanosensitive channel n=2 Tax=Nitrosospira briensis TaxID=35799 RepID=A0A1I4YNQ7_9PROT|nr:Small-conductance mechanosensitive channel [Nitrosospira briensis]
MFSQPNKFAAALLSLFFLAGSAAFQRACADEPVGETVLTPAQAKRTLSILQDDKQRAELEQTLSAIAQATAAAPAEPAVSGEFAGPAEGADRVVPVAPVAPTAAEEAVPIELTQGGLVDQVFDLIGQRLDMVVNQLQFTARMLLEVKTVGQWWQYNLGVPERRSVVLEALWEAAVILAGALFAEWLLRRALSQLRKLVEDRAADRQMAINRKKEKAQEAEETERAGRNATPVVHSHATVVHGAPAADRHWSLLRRFPFALAHWMLELIPLAAFVGVAIALLNAFGGRDAIFYSATLPVIGAYATTRIVLSVVHLMASPLGQGLRLMHISDGAADYLNRWLRRIVIVAVFGTAIADISLETGGTQNTHDALSKLVGLVVHVMLLIMVFRSRAATAAAIRGMAADSSGAWSGLRGILADSWIFVATFFIVATWLLWSLAAKDGFQSVLNFFALSAAVIVGASLVSIFVLGAIDRAFIDDRKTRLGQEEQPGQPESAGHIATEAAAKSTYHLLVHRAVSILIAIIALIVLLQVWGVDTLSWFESGSVGRRLASAVATIAVTCALAVAAWEALNTTISRRIDQWTEAGDVARAARLRTLVPMLRTMLFFVIAMVVLLAALDQLGITIAPLLAGASIIGVALGFGSQKLVQDFITGIFLLMENAIQVGDFITVANVSGAVEHLSIRTVRLRAPDGSLHVVPFSSVSTVTNTNRGIGNASIRVSVTADSDVDKVFAAIRSVGAEMQADPQFKDLILADIDIWGVDQIDGSMITILGQIRTLDRGRWPVQRGFNRRILQRFREQGIQLVNPQERQVVTQASSAPPDGENSRSLDTHTAE